MNEWMNEWMSEWINEYLLISLKSGWVPTEITEVSIFDLW